MLIKPSGCLTNPGHLKITHVAERHIVKELSLKGAENSSMASIAALIGGASKSAAIAFSQAVDKAVEMISGHGYKKEYEMQADAGAVLLCALSGYDPSSFIAFLGRIGEIKSGVGTTYPVYDVRLTTLKKVISDEGVASLKLALNTERFTNAMKPDGGPNMLNLFRKAIPGGTHD